MTVNAEKIPSQIRKRLDVEELWFYIEILGIPSSKPVRNDEVIETVETKIIFILCI